MYKQIICEILLVSLLMITDASAYDDKITHPDITNAAIEFSQIDQYLKSKINAYLGVETRLTLGIENKTIMKWLEKGSTDEDKEPCRRANHMHNPMNWVSWNDSYMSDDPWWVTYACSSWGRKYSNVTWATGYLAPAPDGTKQEFTMAQQYAPNNWDKARQYYYSALTSLTTTARETALAQTFKAVGQVMHLLEDMAVPAHTRNDFASHLMYDGLLITGFYQPYERYVQRNPGLVATATGIQVPEFAYTSLTQFWDTNLYSGNNPTQDWSRGLAEFTNSQYFSDTTIPANNPGPEHYFYEPHITHNGYQVCEDFVLGSTTDTRKYVSRQGKPGCDHFAFVSMLNPMIYMNDVSYLNENIANVKLGLDDSVHNTYAKELLPRAVGYAAGLLKYFFRGSIDIALPERGFYALAIPSDEGFTTIKVLAKNSTENGEEMPDGWIKLVVKYQPTQDAPFVYQVASEATGIGIRTIPRDAQVELTFNLSAPILLTATDVSLQLVYHGRLGNEVDAVAVGFKDISEPTPIDISNNQDLICLNGGWYEAGSDAAIIAVDTDGTIGNNNGYADEWDVNQHTMRDTYIKISSAANPQAASSTDYDVHVPEILAGHFARTFYILTGDQFGYGFSVNRVSDNPSDSWIHPPTTHAYAGTGLKNQTEYTTDSAKCSLIGASTPCYYREPVSYYNFRGADMWWGGGFIYVNKPYPENTQCAF